MIRGPQLTDNTSLSENRGVRYRRSGLPSRTFARGGPARQAGPMPMC